MNSFFENVDPASYTPSTPCLSSPTESALNELQRYSSSDITAWLHNLLDQTAQVGAPENSEESGFSESDFSLTIKWMGKLFDEFELYAMQFNTKVPGTDLIVNCSPPSLENAPADSDQFNAHLSTRFWCMAFAGGNGKLDVYLIPAELLLAFTTNNIKDTEYRPFLTIESRQEADRYDWTVGARTVTWETIPSLAKELFANLINVASGNIEQGQIYTEEQPAPAPEDEKLKASSCKTVSVCFWQACATLSDTIETEIHAISSEKPSSKDEMAGCQKLLSELQALKLQIISSIKKIKELSE